MTKPLIKRRTGVPEPMPPVDRLAQSLLYLETRSRQLWLDGGIWEDGVRATAPPRVSPLILRPRPTTLYLPKGRWRYRFIVQGAGSPEHTFRIVLIHDAETHQSTPIQGLANSCGDFVFSL